jgi:shikimate kinase
VRLIILHGAPASGKLTLACKLSQHLGFAVMHNRLTVGLAMAVYPHFGYQDFYSFVDELRFRCVTKTCENQIKGVILTLCYDVEQYVESVQNWINRVELSGGSVLPIYLDVAVEVLHKRVTEDSRLGTRKLASTEQLDAVLRDAIFGPIAHVRTVIVNTSALTEDESIDAISAAIGAVTSLHGRVE